jgi:hypothetical protein
MSGARWHCGETQLHPSHGFDGDLYRGPGGYTCTGRPGDAAVYVPEFGLAFKRSQVDAFAARVEQDVRQRDDDELAHAAVHPWKGPNDTDASMLIEAAKRAEGGYQVGGSNTQAQVGRVLRLVAAQLARGGSDAN